MAASALNDGVRLPAELVALPIGSPARAHVLVVSDDVVAAETLRRALEVDGLVAQIVDARASLVIFPVLAQRAVIFVDLSRRSEFDPTRLAAWRQRVPHATWIALVERLDGERAARLLAAGIASLPKPVASDVLANLAQSLAQSAEACPPSGVQPRFGAGGDLTPALESYAGLRALSRQQRLILGLYLGGSNDKLIAERCGCSEATVYEHWRRMAKKAGGTHKADAIGDFHRFLAGE